MSSGFIKDLNDKSGYFVNDTDEVFNEEVEIYTDKDFDLSDVSIAEFPEKVVLRCILEKEKLQIAVKFKNLEIYKSNYDACKSVLLKYDQSGKIFFSNGETKDFFDKKINNYTLEFDDILLKKEFKYQASGQIEYDERPKTIRLLHYGGSSSDKIDKIEQMFFHITNASNTPGVAISNEDFWKKKGIDPYAGGRIGDISVIPVEKNDNQAYMIRNGAIKARIYDENTNEEFFLESSEYVQKGEIVEILLEREH